MIDYRIVVLMPHELHVQTIFGDSTLLVIHFHFTSAFIAKFSDLSPNYVLHNETYIKAINIFSTLHATAVLLLFLINKIIRKKNK